MKVQRTDRRYVQRLGATFIVSLWTCLAPVAPARCGDSPASGPSSLVTERVNWPEFLGRHDLVWDQLPKTWEQGAFLGNGQLGAMIYAPAKGSGLRWHLGRSDVVLQGNRIPIGDLVLRPEGKIVSCTTRLDLWNAEASGTLKTDRGQIDWRTFTHADRLVQVIDYRAGPGESACKWEWLPGLAANPRLIRDKTPIPEDQKCPPPSLTTDGALHVCVQPLPQGAEHATVWAISPAGGDQRVLYASVGFAGKEGAARAEAARAVRQAEEAGLEWLRASHRAWWHKYWPESFVSIPDTRLESFYWIQMYKLASGTRADRPALDLMGPWYRDTPWPRIWWNLNIQLTYWPVLGSNRLELGESLCRMLDNNGENLARNAGRYSGDSATIARTSSYDCAGKGGKELCNLPWAVHNYWLQYRYSMDDERLRQHLFPLLKRSINFYLHQLKKGPDGKLHIPLGYSPEYPVQPTPNPDCNIDLALLRWGCQTLLEVCRRLKLDDPQIPQWQATLDNLTPYPTNKDGLMISATVPFDQSHRHYSHLLMIYPLYIMNPEQEENRMLINRSADHWMGLSKALRGYSFTGAASICAAVGRRDDAVMYLNRLLDTKIHPNTMYTEAGPVIETPLSAAQSVHDILLTSWGDRIRAFPGVPDSWKDVTIHNMRTEGAFLVSAVRKDGKTAWVRVKSLAGEPCRVQPSLAGEVKIHANRAGVQLKAVGRGVYDVGLAKGEEAVLYTGDRPPDCVVQAVRADEGMCNYYGIQSGRPASK